MVDGIRFDSAKEARRYQELKLLEQAHRIMSLRLQPRYTLCALVVTGADYHDVNAGTIANRRHPVCEYRADFEYREHDGASGWRTIIEDVKGIKTDLYKLKKRLFEAQYGITIRET